MNNNVYQIEIAGIDFFSSLDEEFFFEWLNKISCIKEIQGKGLSIFLSVDLNLANEDDVRNLIGLYGRYEIDMEPLVVFDMDEFSDWFRSKEAFWYKSIFK